MRISDWSSDVCSSDLSATEDLDFKPLNELDIQTRRGRRVAHPLKRASKAIRQGLETGVTTIRQDDVIASVADALQYISYYHPMDYIRALGADYEAEQGPAAKDAIAQILTNRERKSLVQGKSVSDSGDNGGGRSNKQKKKHR